MSLGETGIIMEIRKSQTMTNQRLDTIAQLLKANNVLVRQLLEMQQEQTQTTAAPDE